MIMNWLAFNFILGLILCIFVYLDAKTRRMNARSWFILTFCFGLFGAVIYLLLRGDVVKSRSQLRDEKRKVNENAYNEGVNYVLNTAKYKDMSLEEIEYFLINIEDDESIIDDYVESRQKNEENYKKGFIRGLKMLLVTKKHGKSTI